MVQERATMGGGCFWCLEAVFGDLAGVSKVKSGYAGGQTPAPTYQEVCTGETGHAEVVQFEYDPQVISYKELLEIFFSIHDPTTLNRQGNDVGTQYRSVIFYHNEEQKSAAFKVREEMAPLWPAPIVTEIVKLAQFYPAEEYHRNYFHSNPDQSYCRVVVAPKVAKFRNKFAAKLRT